MDMIESMSQSLMKYQQALTSYREASYNQFMTNINLANVSARNAFYIAVLMAVGTIFALGMTVYNNNRLRVAKGELKYLNENLENKVQERTEQLNDSNKEIKKALEQLKNTQEQLVESEKMASLGGLVAGVAHEINTPVGIGVTAVSFLRERTIEIKHLAENEKIRKVDLLNYLNINDESTDLIYNNLKRAAHLIQSFKQVSVDHRNEEKQKFNIKEKIDELLLSINPKVKKSDVELTFNCPDDLEFYTNLETFSDIFTNLIMNSLKHAFKKGETGEINIDVSVIGNNLDIDYTDNGKGIPEKDLKNIFDPFFTTARNTGGCGLGLHILYNTITQAYRGKINCKSNIGEGVHFTIEIPMQNSG
jgi:signal transduction histidine kinase